MTLTDEKPAASRKVPKRTLGLFAGAALAVIVLVGVYLAGWSSMMGVDQVKVTGAEELPADQLVATSGITAGTPMMRVDLRAAEARLSDLPQIASADVRRVWPRTVVITVSERGLVAMQKTANGWELLDANGSPFAVAADKPKDLPTVKQSPDAATNTAMLRALAGMSADVRSQVLSVSAQSPNSIRLTLRSNDAVVNWGSAEDSELKSDVLAVLMSTDAGWIDVSNPRTPTTADAPPAPAPSPTSTQIPNPAGSPSPSASASAVPETTAAPIESAVGVVPD